MADNATKEQIVLLGFIDIEEYMTAHAVLMDPISRVMCLIAVCGEDVDTVDKTLTGAVDCPQCLEMIKGMF